MSMNNNDLRDPAANGGNSPDIMSDNNANIGKNAVGGAVSSSGATMAHNNGTDSKFVAQGRIARNTPGVNVSGKSDYSFNDANLTRGMGRHDAFKILKDINEADRDPSTHPVFTALSGRLIKDMDVRNVNRVIFSHEDMARADFTVKPNFKAYRNNSGVMMMNDMRDYAIYRLWVSMSEQTTISEQTIERILSMHLRENLSRGEAYKRTLTFSRIVDMCATPSGCLAALAALKFGCESAYVTGVMYRAEISNLTDYAMFRSIIKTLMEWDDKQVPGQKSVLDGVGLKPIKAGLATNVASISISGMVDYISTIGYQAYILYNKYTLDPHRIASLIEIAVISDIISGMQGSFIQYQAMDDLERLSKHPLIEILRGTKQYWDMMDDKLTSIAGHYSDAVGHNQIPEYDFEWFNIPDVVLESDEYKVMLATLQEFIIDVKEVGHYQLYTKRRREDAVRADLTNIYVAPRLATTIGRYNFIRNMGPLRLLTRANALSPAEDILSVDYRSALVEMMSSIYDKMAFYRMETEHKDIVTINSQKIEIEMPDSGTAEILMATRSEYLRMRMGVRMVKVVLATPLTNRQRNAYDALELESHCAYLIPVDRIDSELLSRQMFRLEHSGLVEVNPYKHITLPYFENLAVNAMTNVDHLQPFTIDTTMLVMYGKERATVSALRDWVDIGRLIRHGNRATDILCTIEASLEELIMRDLIRFMMNLNVREEGIVADRKGLYIEALGLLIPDNHINKAGLADIRKDLRLIFTDLVEKFYDDNRKILLSPRYSACSPLTIEECARSITNLLLCITRLVAQDQYVTDADIAKLSATIDWNTADLDFMR